MLESVYNKDIIKNPFPGRVGTHFQTSHQPLDSSFPHVLQCPCGRKHTQTDLQWIRITSKDQHVKWLHHTLTLKCKLCNYICQVASDFLVAWIIDPSCALSSDSSLLLISLHLRIPSVISQCQELLPFLELPTLLTTVVLYKFLGKYIKCLLNKMAFKCWRQRQVEVLGKEMGWTHNLG